MYIIILLQRHFYLHILNSRKFDSNKSFLSLLFYEHINIYAFSRRFYP